MGKTKKQLLCNYNMISALEDRFIVRQEFVNGSRWSGESREGVPEDMTLSKC